MPALLDPLTDDQQRLVFLIAEAFSLDGEWPVFDYLEGTFDRENRDAWATLASFPRVGSWGYSAVWWFGMNNVALKPGLDQEVALTVLGMRHSEVMGSVVQRFFDLIELMIHRRATAPLDRRHARELVITDADAGAGDRRALVDPEERPELFFKVMEREPFFGSSSTLMPDGHWTKAIPREVLTYKGVSSIDEYVARIESLTAFPQVPAVLSTPSPLDLVATLDYLDAVWRAAKGNYLFDYPSAERAAKLVYPANTPEEFDSRLSALGEILRSANTSAKTVAGEKLAGATRDDPLAPFENCLVKTVSSGGEGRIRQAVEELEYALSIRDAAQHTEAGARAVLWKRSVSGTRWSTTHKLG